MEKLNADHFSLYWHFPQASVLKTVSCLRANRSHWYKRKWFIILMQKLGFAFSPILKVRVVQTSSDMASDVDEANGTLWLVTRFVPQEKKK